MEKRSNKGHSKIWPLFDNRLLSFIVVIVCVRKWSFQMKKILILLSSLMLIGCSYNNVSTESPDPNQPEISPTVEVLATSPSPTATTETKTEDSKNKVVSNTATPQPTKTPESKATSIPTPSAKPTTSTPSVTPKPNEKSAASPTPLTTPKPSTTPTPKPVEPPIPTPVPHLNQHQYQKLVLAEKMKISHVIHSYHLRNHS